MRSAAHIVEDLCFEIDFASEDEAFEAQERLTRFAQKRAQQVIADVFDEAIGTDAVLRLEKLEVDVGTLGMEDFEERFAERLREQLMRLLRERREALDSRAAPELPLRLGQDVWRESAQKPEWAVGQESVAQPGRDAERALPAQSSWNAGRNLTRVSSCDIVSTPSPGRAPTAGRSMMRYRPAASGLCELFDPEPCAADCLTTGARAELGWLLHFVEHGFLPWHAPGHLARELQALAVRVLQGNGVQLAQVFRGVPRARMRVIFNRLVTQFSTGWLAQLGREIRLARRTASGAPLEWPVASGAAGTAVKPLTTSGAHLTTPRLQNAASRPTAEVAAMAAVAAVAEVSSSGGTGSGNASVTHTVAAEDLQEDLARSRTRAQIEMALGEPPDSDFEPLPSLPSTLETWRRVLRADKSWLKNTLERMGKQIRVRRQLVSILPEDVVKDVLGLWLSADQADLVCAMDAAETKRLPNRGDRYRTEPTPSTGEIDRSEAPSGASRASRLLTALSYIFVGGGAGRFTEEEFRLSLARLDAEEVRAAADSLTQAHEGLLRGGLTPRPVLGGRSSVDPTSKPGTRTESSGTGASTATDIVHVGAVTRVVDAGNPPYGAATEAIILARKSMIAAHDTPLEVCRPVGSGTAPDVSTARSGAAELERRNLSDAEHLKGPLDLEPKAADGNLSGAKPVGLQEISIPASAPAIDHQGSPILARVAAIGHQDSSSFPHVAAVSPQDGSGPAGAARLGLQNPARTNVDKANTLAPTQPKNVRDTHVVDSDNLHEELARSRARTWIEAVLDETLEPDPRLVGLAPEAAGIWRSVLRDDAAWITATLVRLGRSVRVRRRVAALLPKELVADLLALWLSPDQLLVVFSALGTDMLFPRDELANASIPQGVISAEWLLATLTYLLVEGGAWEFSEAAYRGSLARGPRDGSGGLSDGPRTPRHASGGLRDGPHEMRDTNDARSQETRAAAAPNIGGQPRTEFADCPVQGRDDAKSERDSSDQARLDGASSNAIPASRTPSGPQRVHQQNPAHEIQADAAHIGLTPPHAAELGPARAGPTLKDHRRPDATLQEPASVAPPQHVDPTGEAAISEMSCDQPTTLAAPAPTPTLALMPAPAQAPAQPPTPPLAQAPATDAMTSDIELFRHLRGRGSSNSSTHDLRQALRAMLDRRSAAARHELLSALEYPGAGRRLITLIAGAALPELLKWLRPADGELALTVAARVARLINNASNTTDRGLEDATGRVSTGHDGTDNEADTNTDEDATTRVANAFLVTELFEEGRTFDPEPFAQRLTAALETSGLAPAITNVGGVQGAKRAPTEAHAIVGNGFPGSTGTREAVPSGPKRPDWVHSSSSASRGAYTAGGTPPVRPVSSVEDATLHQRIHITNAGVVLVGPYLQRLFSMLELTNETAFISPRHAHRAVHLIQYIVTAATTTPEPMLVLNKILCGLPISEPVPLDIDLRARERAAIEEMLAAVIAHWNAIGRTSIAGLRESFLQREGRLVSTEESWQLRVETKSFDMLLDRLPWGYTTVKFPWMKRVLHVDWR